MCGIIGIISKEKWVSYDIYHSLLNLQHRGQDNAGIFTTDDQYIYLEKGKGLVSEIFNNVKLEQLKGRMGIGQVRYPTTVKKEDAQPFYIDLGGIALAHNGNVYNETALRQRLKENRIFCDSDCDAETILKLFYYYFDKSRGTIIERCFNAAKLVMQKVDGSYSVVSVIRGAGFFAFRDPHGIRPFVFGKKMKGNNVNAYAFASESVAIEDIVDNIEHVKCGEGIFIDQNLKIYRKVLLKKNPQHCMFEWVYFSRSVSKLEGSSINHVRGNLGKELAKKYQQSPLYERLSNQKNKIIVAAIPETSRPASITFARQTKYQYKDILEKNRFIGRIFIKPNEKLRRSEIIYNVKVIEEVVKNKIVFLIDDSIVRGTTSKGIIKKIKSKGAKEVHLFSTCPPIVNPCYYGVNMPTKKELIAHNKTLKDIEEYTGADSITYITIDELASSIGLHASKLCLACLNGRYPTPLLNYIDKL